MTIRTKLLILSLFVGLSIAVITLLFYTSLASLVQIEHESGQLVTLADSVRNLSIAVNSLDSNQYRNILKKFHLRMEESALAFDELAKVQVLPKINDQLKEAFEIISNMRALITDDLKILDDQFTAFQPELERYFMESNSTSIRMFYTNDRIRSQNDLTEVFVKLEDLITLINSMTETLAGVSDTIQSQSVVIKDETGKIRDQSLLVALLVSAGILMGTVLISLMLGTSISRRVKDMQRRLVTVSQGDFSQYLPVRGSDEVAEITKTVNLLLDSLNRLLGQVQDKVESLNTMSSDLFDRMVETTTAVDHIQSNMVSSHSQLMAQTEAVSSSVISARNLGGSTDNLSLAFQTQMEILGSSSAGIEQIIANIGSVNNNTARAENSSQILLEVSREGQTKLNLVAASVQEISQSSENLVQVTAIINDIADKTNLLAMNASIEAAHAGDAGKGFGVVAAEIRKLAEQAAAQSREISKDLQIVNENIQAIQAATSTAVEVFSNIVTQTGNVSSIVKEVQVSMSEQNSGGTQVLEGIHKLNTINNEVGQAIQKMKQGETEILDRIQELAKQNTMVNANNEAVNQKTLEINEIIRQTNILANSTREQIRTLEQETSQFKTKGQDEDPPD